MLHPALRCRRFVALVLFATASAASAVMAGPPRFRPLDAPPGDPAQALLVFVIDAPYAIRAVVLAGAGDRELASLEVKSVAGEYVARAFALPPGRYRIAGLVAPDFQRAPFAIRDAPWFELAAARLNYVGDFELYLEHRDLMCRLKNRSGRLMIHLREHLPALVAFAPLAFVGGDDDGWIGALGGAERRTGR